LTDKTAQSWECKWAGRTLKKLIGTVWRTVGAQGTIKAELYAHTGTFGTSSEPTGSALATSVVRNVKDISTTSGSDFQFNFTDGFEPTVDTYYCVVIDLTGVTTDSV
ncbi:MAG: hypothetical protein GWN13_19175, partial [Phycisphaerae bacterium]|nr:hypothetical protein [Phycisphaerae bacterium]